MVMQYTWVYKMIGSILDIFWIWILEIIMDSGVAVPDNEFKNQGSS